MANNSPTIVAASLSDDQLKKSIDSLVTHVDEAMKKMVQSTNNAVGEMEAKLKSLGNLKIDTGGSNDGGTGRRTQQHDKLTKAVNDASEAVSKETQKLQDLQQSLSGASDREQNFISQKERAAGTIAQENELLRRQEQELGQLRSQQQAFVSSEQSQTSAINAHKTAFDNLDAKTKEYLSTQERLLQKGSGITPNERKLIGIDQQTLALIERAKRELDSFNLTLSDGTKYSKDPFSSKFQSLEILKKELDNNIRSFEQWKKETRLTPDDITKIDAVLQKYKEYSRIIDELRNKETKLLKNHDVLKFTDDFGKYFTQKIPLVRADESYQDAYWKLQKALSQTIQTEQQKAQIDAQVAAKEKEIAETKGRIAAATKEQSEAEKNASQAAKEKTNILSQVANQEKQVAEAKKQLATATQQQAEVEKQSVQNIAQQTAARDKQIKKNQEVATSFDKMASAQQVSIRSASPSGIRNADTLQTMNIQLDLLRERLREARQQYSSFVALAAHATTTGDKGLFQYATDGVHRYEQEVRNLIPQIRTLQSGIQQMGDVIAPQGHTIQNYVNSLQKANPELAALNAQYKSGTSLLQDQSTSYASATQSAQRYTEEIRKQAQAIRESKQWKETGTYSYQIGNETYYVSKKQGEIEAQLVRHKEQQVNYQKDYLTAGMAVEQNTKQQAATEEKLVQAEQQRLGIEQEIAKARREYISPTTTTYAAPTTDMLRKFIANKAGVDVKDVKMFDETTASANKLQSALKQVQTAYSNMSAEERNSPFGQALIRRFQELQRESQKTQQQLSRPTSLKSVMGLDEKTLDDIAYKMQRLSSYRSGLNVDTQKKEIQQVNDEYNRLKKRMDKVMQKNQQMIASNTALGRSWNYMKNRLAFYFTVGASTSFIKNLIEVRSQYEMNERALGILVNSAERGTQIFNELSQMALVSPYTLIELSAAAKQLTAYDVAAKDVVDTTRRLADMAAAVGIPIERLTYALGQIKAYGYLNARDARMFANAGIPLVKQLSEYYTELEGRLVSTADIYDRIKKKSIGYEEVTSVIAKMTDEGGKFYDFQAKMAETLKVQLANLTLAWNNMLNAMGEESQGVLVGGISTLKQVFLHWKDIEHVLYELIVALGAYKAYQIITTRLMGATSASLDAQVLAMKRNKAAMLEKQALTRKLTVDELRQVAAQNQVTAADYRNALSGKQLTKQKALLLVALNKNNVQLKAAVVNMGLLTTQEVANITTGNALAIVFKSIGISIRNAALAIKAFAASMWPLLVAGAIYELYHAWDSYGEHVKEVNKQAAEHAKEAFDNIKQYLESESTINTRQRVVYKEGNPLTDAESQKAWDEMREKIELSSSASNTFVAKLMQINDINSRLADGFDYLRDVQRVAGVMQTLEEDAVNISSTTLGGLFGEGLKDDLEDFINAYQKYVSLNENLRQSGVGEEYFNNQKRALEEFRGEVEKTTTSLYNIASKEGFNTNEQREFFEREISEIAQAEQMGAKETRIFRMQAEKEYYAYARAQLVAQLEYQQGAQKAATEKRIKDLDNEFGANKALQESFFTWLTEKQDHAVKNMLRGKTQEEIKQGEWLKGSNAKWVEEMARKFSKEYGVSFDDLHKLVLNANTWSINIPVFFQTIGQPLSDVQRDYEARTGKKFSSNPLIKDAKTQVDILDILKKKQKEVANEMETARKAGGKYWEDNEQRYKEENDALVADIHAYNALTDAEEKANKKSGKGSKKDPLLDALKQEISLVEKLQSDYDKLSKSGASQADALDTIRGAYGKTIRLLNAQLQSYGLPQIDISQLITGKDPNKALAHFKQTLDTLVSKGMLTLERSKELEAVVEKFTLSAKTYNLDMITKGLNNELGKLKDEYELAVELDANPEMGNMFAEMFGVDTSAFPRTINEFMQMAQQEFEEARKKLNLSQSINIFTANQEQWYKWGEAVGYSKERVDDFKKSFDGAVDVAKKWATDVVKQTQDLQYKLADNNGKIAIEEEKLANLKIRFANEVNDEQKRLLGLQIRDQQSAINKLKEEILQLLPTYNRLFGEVAEHSAAMTRKLARDYKNMLVDALKRGKNPDGTYTIIDPVNGKSASVTEERLGKEIKNANKELGKTDNIFKKIKESLKKGEDGIVDWVGGIENIGEAIGQVGDLVDTIGNVYDMFGNPNEYDATSEALHDIATTMQGVNTAAKGIGQIASGDYIGGAISVISGLSSAIGAWFDNSDKEILAEIKESERAVKRLENAYKELEYAAGNAFGAATSGAQEAIKANKELQLVELKRQLALEQSRDSKHRDEDRIIEIRGQIIDLEHEIKDFTKDAVNDLLGISSHGDFFESMISEMIEAFKNGEDAMEVFEEKWSDMIDNMIMKTIVSQVLSQWVKTLESGANDILEKYTEESSKKMADLTSRTSDLRTMNAIGVSEWIYDNDREMFNQILESLGVDKVGDMSFVQRLFWFDNAWNTGLAQKITDAYLAMLDNNMAGLQDELDKQSLDATGELIDYYGEAGKEFKENYLNQILDKIQENWNFGQDSEKQLSNLQQGISQISETTANALEAYMNSVNQQVYYHSSLLEQIRDSVVGLDLDVSLGVQSQMLLQLQNSYQTQQAIQQILEGVLTPSGRAFSVELLS